MISLILRIGMLTTTHNVSALSYAWNQFTYTDSSGLHLCSGVTRFEWFNGASVTVADCEPIFRNGFEVK